MDIFSRIRFLSSPKSGSQANQFLSQLSISQPIYDSRFVNCSPCTSKTRLRRCFPGGRSFGSRWDWDRKVNRRSRFTDGYATDDYDLEDEFGFRNPGKQRTWWSDDYYEDDEGFGILEASIGFNWVFKVFRAFGWMIPAVIVSLVMGTGPDATIITALALPLAQSALSLAVDTLWGRSGDNRRTKSRSKKRPFAGAARQSRVRKEKESRTQTRKEAVNYKSWVDSDSVSARNEKRNSQDFGGWDELD